MYTVLLMEKPNGHKKNETIVLNSEPLIFKKSFFSEGNTMNELKLLNSARLFKVNASAMTKWRPNRLGDLMVT